MITKIDTDEVERISKDLTSAINDLESEINTLFTRFSNVPNVTKEWIGGQADFYFSRVALDKRQYLILINKLRSIAQELNSEASSAQTCIKANNTKD